MISVEVQHLRELLATVKNEIIGRNSTDNHTKTKATLVGKRGLSSPRLSLIIKTGKP